MAADHNTGPDWEGALWESLRWRVLDKILEVNP
jgi:hypothetical protein